jgi:hypothetical protein
VTSIGGQAESVVDAEKTSGEAAKGPSALGAHVAPATALAAAASNVERGSGSEEGASDDAHEAYSTDDEQTALAAKSEPDWRIEAALGQVTRVLAGSRGPLNLNLILGATTAITGGDFRSPASIARPAATSDVVDGVLTSYTLGEVDEVFAFPANYWKARLVLTRRRVVVLAAAPGTGRRTAALHLLHGQRAEQVRIVPLGRGNLEDLIDGISEDGSFLVDATGIGQTELTLDSLQAVAEKAHRSSAYVVILADDLYGRRAEFSQWTSAIEPPDPAEVLRRHLRYHLGEEHSGTWEPWSREPRVLAVLEETRQPATVVQTVVEFLLGVAAGRYDLSGIAEISLKHNTEYAAEILASSEISLAQKALMLAVAAFEGCDYSLIVERAERLHQCLRGVYKIAEEAPPNPFGSSRTALLAGVSARFSPMIASSRTLSPYSETVTFVRPRFSDAVLTYVWDEYTEVRQALIGWLADTPVTGGLHRLAGRALGTLSVRPPGLRFEEVRTWARDDQPRRRHLAAAVLDTALATEPYLAPALTRTLSGWSSAQDVRLRHTAALVLGGAYGRQRPTLALRRLRRLAERSEEQQIADAVLESVLALAVDPDSRPDVVLAIEEWARTRDDRLRALAIRGAVQLVVADIRALQASMQASVDSATRTSDADVGIDAEATRLWKILLEDVETLVTFEGELIALLERADASSDIRELIIAHVAAAVAGTDRGAQRLVYSLTRWAYDRPNSPTARAIEAIFDPSATSVDG